MLLLTNNQCQPQVLQALLFVLDEPSQVSPLVKHPAVLLGAVLSDTIGSLEASIGPANKFTPNLTHVLLVRISCFLLTCR